MKRLTLLTLTVLLASCGPSGGGGVTPPPPNGGTTPPPGTIGADGWPVFTNLALMADGTLVEGGMPVTLSVNQAAPAGYRWWLPNLENFTLGRAAFQTAFPDGDNSSTAKMTVTGARQGLNRYALMAQAYLAKVGSTESKRYLMPLHVSVDGKVAYPMYPQAQREPTAMEREVLRLINIERVTGTGCGPNAEYTPAGPPMEWHDGLAAAARQQAYDMMTRGYFSHTSPEGFRSPDLTSLFGVATFGGGGDNIGTGYITAQEVVKAWLESPGHCIQMLNPARRFAGVGHFKPSDLTGDKWVLNVIDAVY